MSDFKIGDHVVVVATDFYEEEYIGVSGIVCELYPYGVDFFVDAHLFADKPVVPFKLFMEYHGIQHVREDEANGE